MRWVGVGMAALLFAACGDESVDDEGEPNDAGVVIVNGDASRVVIGRGWGTRVDGGAGDSGQSPDATTDAAEPEVVPVVGYYMEPTCTGRIYVGVSPTNAVLEAERLNKEGAVDLVHVRATRQLYEGEYGYQCYTVLDGKCEWVATSCRSTFIPMGGLFHTAP